MNYNIYICTHRERHTLLIVVQMSKLLEAWRASYKAK